MNEQLAGRAVIVTGAATGVGRAVARRFAEAGARLVLADRDEAELTEVAERIREAGDGPEPVAFACDLADPLAAQNLLATTLDAWGRVDVLVNGARKVAEGGLFETDAAALSDLFDSNVRAVFQLSQAVARRMVEQTKAEDPQAGPAGAIIALTSIAARRTLPELLHYSVSCAALDQLTRSMAVALAPHGVRVNGVALGSVMTASLQSALRGRADLREELTSATPLGRVGESREAAEAALFLASEAASFITGQILVVDGGRTMLDPLARPAV